MSSFLSAGQLSNLSIYFSAFFIAAAGVFVLSPLCRALSYKLGALDVPADGRRMHTGVTPRTGGMAVFLVYVMLSPFFDGGIGASIGGLIVFASGLADDIVRLRPWQKLCFQLLGGSAALGFGVSFPILGGSYLLSAGAALFYIVLLANAFNLIDGLDGLCAGMALVATVGAFALSVKIGRPMAIFLLIAGGALGFLPYNLRREKLFLGDEGALFFGFVLAVWSLELMASGGGGTVCPSVISLAALPLLDTVYSFARRVMSGRSPFEADRSHFHHKLVDMGFSQRAAVLLLIIIAAAVAVVSGR